MSKPKTNAKARAALLASTLAAVPFAAMREGQSQQAAIIAVKAALGSIKPNSERPSDKARFTAVRHGYQAGRMCFALFAGSNLPEAEQMKRAVEARDAADASGKGKLAKGQRRRTKAEQAAYDSARQAWSRLLRAAGLVTSDNRGGAANAKGKGTKAPNRKAPVAPKRVEISAADAAKFIPPKAADKEKAVAFVLQQASMLRSFVDAANQRLMKASTETLPVGLCSAVQDFAKAVAAVK